MTEPRQILVQMIVNMRWWLIGVFFISCPIVGLALARNRRRQQRQPVTLAKLMLVVFLAAIISALYSRQYP